MKKTMLMCLFFGFSSSAFAQGISNINQKAIWRPDSNAIGKIMACYSEQEKYVSCVADVMRKSGASLQAINFTKEMQGRSFVQKFFGLGKVDYIETIEIGADYNSGYYLVNGASKIINVDNWNLIKNVDKNIWSGNHDFMQMRQTENGGQTFIFSYELKKCNACAVLGHVKAAFDFDNSGKLLGVKKTST